MDNVQILTIFHEAFGIALESFNREFLDNLCDAFGSVSYEGDASDEDKKAYKQIRPYIEDAREHAFSKVSGDVLYLFASKIISEKPNRLIGDKMSRSLRKKKGGK